jgi:hypothetical protein
MVTRQVAASEQARKGWPFFLLFVLVGLGMLVPFVLQAVRDYRIAWRYQPTDCQVLRAMTVSSSSTSRLGGTMYRTDASHQEFSWDYTIDATRYVAEGFDNHDGIMAEGRETSHIATGVRMTCWYDPADPQQSVLVRHFRAEFYLGALIPGFFILIGGGLLRRSLRRRPDYADVKVSQGEQLGFRLSPILSTRGIAGCLSIIILALAVVIFGVLPRISFGDVAPSLLGGLMAIPDSGCHRGFSDLPLDACDACCQSTRSGDRDRGASFVAGTANINSFLPGRTDLLVIAQSCRLVRAHGR